MSSVVVKNSVVDGVESLYVQSFAEIPAVNSTHRLFSLLPIGKCNHALTSGLNLFPKFNLQAKENTQSGISKVVRINTEDLELPYFCNS